MPVEGFKTSDTMELNQKVLAIDPFGNLSPGEYTGFSMGVHWVSFYNGYTGRYKSITALTQLK